MTRDLNTHQTPSGGWQFRQIQTGWAIPNPISVTFSQAMTEIVKHRLKNPVICVRHKLSTDPNAVGTELMNFNRARLGIPIPGTASPNFFAPRRSVPEVVVAAAGNIRRAAAGAAVVIDWLQSGGAPVERELAERRATTCINCPKNVEGSWYTTAPAEIIREALEARKDLDLSTTQDAGLKSCDVCKCLMRLKVWCPLSHILERTKPEIMAEFPKEHCWIARKDQ